MKEFKSFKQKWKNLMDSTQKKLSRGASNINKIITWAKGDNWRRKQNVKKHKKD